ncbi:EF hand [Novosphingobium sp. CF614]|uniref:EF-hand domain-containing protein n=1 Tax=Novosphingobium sp. CF614 TaxID=1884364 RepID=UPI0008EF32D2|nr:EF-hand domain-containing protein [Novosphingobium sp. CF614]SFG28483.1 EF hand [Novosphingobium sp. CF614]
MNRFLLGGLAVLVMLGVGLFWLQGRAAVEDAAPPPEAQPSAAPEDLPSADAGDLAGPAPPEATALTREQRRFGRYDRDRDGRVSRNEMLSTRSEGFRKLDKDGNNLLTFEEWAVATADKFDQADADRDQWLTPREFARTAPPPRPKPKCSC